MRIDDMNETRCSSGSRRRQGVSVIAAAALLAGGYVAGKVIDGNAVANAAPPSTKDAQVVVELDKIPAVSMPANGFAVVGAGNNRYYIVDARGVARPVLIERHTRNEGRADLFWQ